VSEKSRVAKSFFIELGVYTVLVLVYFFLVLNFLGGWLAKLFKPETRHIYAIVALALMVGQGVVLEMLTTFLLGFIRRRSED
jgi:hypothetical protein